MDSYKKHFSKKHFKDVSDLVVDKLADYLDDTSIRGLHWYDPKSLMKEAKKFLLSHQQSLCTDMDKLENIVDLYIKTGLQVHSPGYMGRQFGGIIPLAGIFSIIGSIVNQPSSLYEAGQLPNVAEKIMKSELNKYIGWGDECSEMLTTHGGTLANLTALLAARNKRYSGVWSRGYSSLNCQTRPAIATSEDVHYGLERAAGILGIGTDQIVRLPLNDNRQICASQLEKTLESAKKNGLDIFCIIATAGSTSIGAFDLIDEIAGVARREDIWLHVDGAHGASFLLSSMHRDKLKGIEKADSITWDAHKMMFLPPLCTLLFFRKKADSYLAFKQEASYMFNKDSITLEYDSAHRTFECTKRPLIMNLWMLWSLYGSKLFENLLDHTCSQALSFFYLLKEQEDICVIHEPQCNIVCFQYVPHKALALQEISKLNATIREKIVRNGKFYISKVDINGITSLRVVFMNPLIDRNYCLKLLEEVRSIASDLD